MAAETYSFPGSSNIAAMTYDPATQTMTIEFNNGSQYEAMNVPAAFRDGLVHSPSPGSYFHRQLKGQFNWTQK